MSGMYVSPERVERNGWLIAFAGEAMSREEAARRGLLAEEPQAPKKAPRSRKKAAE